MSHYAIVKRQKYEVSPRWNERIRISTHHCYNSKFMKLPNLIVKYEGLNIGTFGINYENVISNNQEYLYEVDYWSGRINLLPLEVGESLTIKDEKLTVKKVEKNVDGSIVYQVDDLIVEHEDYDNLMIECEKAYDAYSKLLDHEKRILKVENEIILNDNYQKELLKNKPWWIRIFG